MGTVIDSLVVEFGLDPTEFDKNSKHIADELRKLRQGVTVQSQHVVDSNRRIGDSFHSLRLNIISAIAAFVGARGIADFIRSNITGQAELNRLSRNLDINARRLEAWGTVAEEVGGKAEDSFNALQSVAAQLAEATIKGHSALTDVARANGISLTDARGQLVSSEEVLLRFSQRMQNLPRQQALALAGMAGLGGMGNELLLGPDVLRERLEAAERLSRVTQASARQAEELQRRWADLRATFRGIGEELFTRLEPVLLRVADRTARWLESVNWDEVGRRFDRFVDRFVGFIQQVDRGAEALGGWKPVLEALGALLALRLLSPLLGVVGLLTRLVRLGAPVSGALGSIAGSVRGLGAVLGALDLGALAGVTGLLGAVYSPALGGKRRADGSTEDERERPTRAAPGTDPANLWAAVYGNPTSFKGSREQAALILAKRWYADEMDDATYRQQADEILHARVLPVDARGTGAEIREPTDRGGSGPNDDLFRQVEDKYGLPAGLINRVFQKESGGGRNLVSPVGATGPFQFMPGTAADLGLSRADTFDTGKSADAAGRYLKRLNEMFGGDWTKTLAAYNWGPGNVQRLGLANAPAETRDYVKLAQGLPVGAGAAVGGVPSGSASTDNSTEVSIGTISINTQATDAEGIAQAIRPAIRTRLTADAFNTGVE